MTANQITNKLLIELPKQFRCRVWRHNVGAHMTEGGRFVRFGLPGQPDIMGIIEPGLFLGIEVKAGADRCSDDQVRFQLMIEKYGGIYTVARDVDETIQDVHRLLEWRGSLLIGGGSK